MEKKAHIYLPNTIYYFPAEVNSIEAVAGETVYIPCNLTIPDTTTDNVSLILWYRQDKGTPVYRYVAIIQFSIVISQFRSFVVSGLDSMGETTKYSRLFAYIGTYAPMRLVLVHINTNHIVVEWRQHLLKLNFKLNKFLVTLVKMQKHTAECDNDVHLVRLTPHSCRVQNFARYDTAQEERVWKPQQPVSQRRHSMSLLYILALHLPTIFAPFPGIRLCPIKPSTTPFAPIISTNLKSHYCCKTKLI